MKHEFHRNMGIQSPVYTPLTMEFEGNMVIKSPVYTPLSMEFERNMGVEHLYMPFYDFP